MSKGDGITATGYLLQRTLDEKQLSRQDVVNFLKHVLKTNSTLDTNVQFALEELIIKYSKLYPKYEPSEESVTYNSFFHKDIMTAILNISKVDTETIDKAICEAIRTNLLIEEASMIQRNNSIFSIMRRILKKNNMT